MFIRDVHMGVAKVYAQSHKCTNAFLTIWNNIAQGIDASASIVTAPARTFEFSPCDDKLLGKEHMFLRTDVDSSSIWSMKQTMHRRAHDACKHR